MVAEITKALSTAVKVAVIFFRNARRGELSTTPPSMVMPLTLLPQGHSAYTSLFYKLAHLSERN